MNVQSNKPEPATVLRGHDMDPGLANSPGPSDGRWLAAATTQLLLVAGLIVLAAIAYYYLLSSAPVAERKARERVPRLVEVVPAAIARQGPLIRAWGEVEAAQTLIVRPELGGMLEWVHPDVTPGGLLTAGTEVARIDKRDLDLALLRAEADIADIRARIQIEEGQAAFGERELSRLSRNITAAQKSLVRREPQMAQLRAELAAAQAVLEQARNAVARATVIQPFDALVIEENISVGTMVPAGSDAATLAASDRFNVVLQVPARSLDWIRTDGSQQVRLMQPGVWPDGASRTGRIVRLGAALSETGRMVELVVEVEDPLALRPANAGQPRLLLGSYLEGEIIGEPVGSAVTSLMSGGEPVRLDRAHLRDGDTVWVMNAENKLEIRDLTIAWRGPEAVLVTEGLVPGDRVVTTPLAAFAPGMALRTRDQGEGKGSEA